MSGACDKWNTTEYHVVRGVCMSVRETSIETYYELEYEGILGEKQLQVWETIRKLGGPTDKEVGVHIQYPASSVSARRNELVEFGVVEEAGKKVCSISGRRALSWRVCERKHRFVKHVQKCPHCNGKGTIETQTKLVFRNAETIKGDSYKRDA